MSAVRWKLSSSQNHILFRFGPRHPQADILITNRLVNWKSKLRKQDGAKKVCAWIGRAAGGRRYSRSRYPLRFYPRDQLIKESRCCRINLEVMGGGCKGGGLSTALYIERQERGSAIEMRIICEQEDVILLYYFCKLINN